MNDCTLYILPFNPTTQTHACHFEACTSFEPPVVTLNEAAIKKGAYTYYLYCESCHGLQISQKHMSQFPDLRKLSEGKHNAFKQIVLGGALAQNGMASFKNSLKEEDVENLQQFLIKQQVVLYKKEHEQKK